MSKGYKLADGSLSTDYEIGDEFVKSKCGVGKEHSVGSVVRFVDDGEEIIPDWFAAETVSGNQSYNTLYKGFKGCYERWDNCQPTPETKHKAQARKRKFPINSGDYIDSREFTREECERFCELAVGCGFPDGEGNRYFDTNINLLGVSNYGCTYWHNRADFFTNNVTTQFREFLDKEKGMNKFTKDDLKDGMRVELRDKDVYYIVGERLAIIDSLTVDFKLSDFNADLTNINDSIRDILKVTDRDGTVLFERQPEKRKVTFELTEEQERELREQLNQ